MSISTEKDVPFWDRFMGPTTRPVAAPQATRPDFSRWVERLRAAIHEAEIDRVARQRWEDDGGPPAPEPHESEVQAMLSAKHVCAPGGRP